MLAFCSFICRNALCNAWVHHNCICMLSVGGDIDFEIEQAVSNLVIVNFLGAFTF